MTDLSADRPTHSQRDAQMALTPSSSTRSPTLATPDTGVANVTGVMGRVALAWRLLGALVGRIQERVQMKYRLFQVAAVVVPRAPMWLARPLTVGGATLAWALAGGMRRRVAANLRHIPALAADPQRLRRATRGVFVTSALNYLDFFRGRYLTDQQALAPWMRADGTLAIDGLDVMRDLLAEGRGLIVFCAHLGNFEEAASCLGSLGYRMITPAEPLSPEPFLELVVRMRRHHGTRMTPGDNRETLREMISALKRNELVVFAVDRYVMGASARFALFGAPARLPTTPVSFALRHNAPVMLLTSWREGGQRSAGICVSLDLSAAGAAVGKASGQLPAPSNVDQAMAIVIAAIERQIAAHPEQWVSALAHVWDDEAVGDDDLRPPTATD